MPWPVLELEIFTGIVIEGVMQHFVLQFKSFERFLRIPDYDISIKSGCDRALFPETKQARGPHFLRRE